MSEKFYFSPSTNSFRIGSMRSLYVSNWPDDLVEVSEECFCEFTAGKTGKVRGVGEDKMPVWEDVPPPTEEQMSEWAKNEKSYRIHNARDVIREWQSELALDMISEKNKKTLKKWLTYISDLKDLDVSDAEKIIWPEVPEQ